jgi:hypothetical protein
MSATSPSVESSASVVTTTPAEPEEAPIPDSRFVRFEADSVAIDVLDRARRFALRTLVAAAFLLVPLAIAVNPAFAFGVATIGLGWVVSLLITSLPWIGPGPGEIVVGPDGLKVTVRRDPGPLGEHEVALADVVSAYRVGDEVRVQTKRGEVLVASFARPELGEMLLRALGQDAQRRVLEVVVPPPASKMPGGTILVWLILICQLPSLIALPFVLMLSIAGRPEPLAGGAILASGLVQAALVVLSVRALGKRVVAIGTDGVVYRRFLRKRFHPYGAMDRVYRTQGGVALALRSGERVRIRTRGFWARGAADHTAEVLHERIEVARRASSSEHVQSKLPLLERRGRPLADWRAHLAALVGKAGYRTGAVTVGDLTAVLADTALPAEHRIAAALALAASEPTEAHTRTRIAAAACADADLRAALDEAAEGEVDEARLTRLMTR